jgi:hypothetical protein
MPPAQRQNFRGPKTTAFKAKAAAVVDPKQRVLSAAFILVAKLPVALPSPAPSASHPKPVYKPHPLGRPKHVGDNVIALEVNAAVHSIIDIIVLDHEKQTVVIEMGCRTMLNSLIDQLLLQNASNAFVDLKSVRQQYNSRIKRKVLDLVAEASSSQGISERQAIKQLRTVAGYEKLTSGRLQQWKKQGPLKKRGRKTCQEFEEQVLAQLIYTKIEKIDSVEQAVIQANIAHSWHVIKLAAQQVQAWPQFLGLLVVQKLKSARSWIAGFLSRQALRRRRITAQDKSLPPPL